MGPVTLAQLITTLYTTEAPTTTTVAVADLAVGHVLARTTWDSYMVVGLPTPLPAMEAGADGYLVPLRHIHGGHTVRVTLPACEPVIVYTVRSDRSAVREIPVIPRCVLPEHPAVGDRIVYQRYSMHLRVGNDAYQYTGSDWQNVSTQSDGTDVVRTYSDFCMRALVSDGPSSMHGWYVYLPAGHHPHLYADGRPVPARSAEHLAPRDVVLLPGRGRLQVEDIRRHADGRTLRLRVLSRSDYVGSYQTWVNRVGDVVEVEDSGRHGLLYATEPRGYELRSAAEIIAGDTVIAGWGTPFSHVGTVDRVWRQRPPLLAPQHDTMHVTCTTPDGRTVRTQTGFMNRFFLLDRPAADHAKTPAVAALTQGHA